MLEAYLMESEDFKELLHYCNVPYNILPMLLRSKYDFLIHLDARKLAAIMIVACGYGGDMPEEQAYGLVDDMDFYYNKVRYGSICWKDRPSMQCTGHIHKNYSRYVL